MLYAELDGLSAYSKNIIVFVIWRRLVWYKFKNIWRDAKFPVFSAEALQLRRKVLQNRLQQGHAASQSKTVYWTAL